MQKKENAVYKWLETLLCSENFSLTALAGDASFRRYFRLEQNGHTRIVMDASAEKNALAAFVRVEALLSAQGLRTPSLQAIDFEQGFALLDDFGDSLLLDSLTAANVNALYQKAIQILLNLQTRLIANRSDQTHALQALPFFDQNFMQKELELCKHWFLQAYLGLSLSLEEERLLDTSFRCLAQEIANQERVFIHRDYHSRNIMLLKDDSLGILDFQDAMQGPFPYDLVSLLKDCYIQWPQETLLKSLDFFYTESPLAQVFSFDTFMRAFDLCGLQRHLKVLGVFSRLFLRDGKANYLKHLPLCLNYVLTCLETYPELEALYLFFKQKAAAFKKVNLI